MKTPSKDAAHAPLKLALILWNGDYGGAEILTARLAEQLRRLGAEVSILFVGRPWPLGERLEGAGLAFHSLGLDRGRGVVWEPGRYAAAAAAAGADGALVVERGFLAAMLRLGGYRAPIVAVEHGSLLVEGRGSRTARRLLRRLGRMAGARVADAEIAVSDYMMGRMYGHSRARRVHRIYNGIDPDLYRPAAEPAAGEEAEIVVGFAGRLVAGKGADHLIRAVAEASRVMPMRLSIAGEGPERGRLGKLAHRFGLGSRVEFLGSVSDMSGFWQSCDVAAVPSDAWVESFSMVTLEAMSCAKPIVASRAGAIPELILDGETGTLVPPGDASALARALLAYGESPELRRRHGTAARNRAIERFNIADCARAYLDLFAELSALRRARAPVSDRLLRASHRLTGEPDPASPDSDD